MPSGVTSRRAHALPRRLPRARVGVVALLTAIVVAAGVSAYLATHTSPGSADRSGHGARGRAAGDLRTPHVTPSPSPLPPHPSGSIGDYAVAESQYSFTEHAGPTLGHRVLAVTVRYPYIAQSQKYGAPGTSEFPLVVFAPGYRQCSGSYNNLLQQWASAGYVVAAVNFPRTNCQVVSPDESDLVHQPADMAFAIAQLARLSSQPSGPLAGLIDASKVAVAGHSDGGDTVAAMDAVSCCRYPGLRAVIALAGAEWPAFAGTWFSGPTPPTLFVQGTADAINPPAVSLQMYAADRTGVRYYLQLAGAGHLTPYEGNGAPEPIVAHVTIAFLDRFLARDGVTVGALRRSGDVANVSELVSGGRLP
jgi:dienelactone hydrolase